MSILQKKGPAKAGIYNLALVKMGITQFVTDPATDNTLDVNTMNKVWESVLNEVLELGEWKCARKRVTLERDKDLVEGATDEEPVVVTATAHTFQNDDLVKFSDVVGMTELNGNTYMVKNKADNTIELWDENGTEKLDGTGFTAWDSGGVIWRVPNYEYSYMFKLPEDCLKVLETTLGTLEWREENNFLLTNAEDDELTIQYIYYLSDPTYFSPLLIDTLATRLAYMVCPALVKDYGPKRQVLDQEFAALLRLARSEDAKWRQQPDKPSKLVTEA